MGKKIIHYNNNCPHEVLMQQILPVFEEQDIFTNNGYNRTRGLIQRMTHYEDTCII